MELRDLLIKNVSRMFPPATFLMDFQNLVETIRPGKFAAIVPVYPAVTIDNIVRIVVDRALLEGWIAPIVDALPRNPHTAAELDVIRALLEDQSQPTTGGPFKLRARPPSPMRAASTGRRRDGLTEEERRELVDIVAHRLTPEDGRARAAWVRSVLMRALLYAPLAGEDYSGSAQAVATTLVTRTESLGDPAIAKLVRALSEEGLVTGSALPFLTALAERLQGAAGDRDG